MRDKDFYPKIEPKGSRDQSFIFFLILVCIKLTEIEIVQDVSWWWITAPLWAPYALGFIFIFFYLIIWSIMHVIIFFQKKFRK